MEKTNSILGYVIINSRKMVNREKFKICDTRYAKIKVITSWLASNLVSVRYFSGKKKPIFFSTMYDSGKGYWKNYYKYIA